MPTSASAWGRYDIEVKNADGVTIYYNFTNDSTELEVTNGNGYSGNVVDEQGRLAVAAKRNIHRRRQESCREVKTVRQRTIKKTAGTP